MIKAIAIALQAGVPILLWGAPGTGKTSAINALGRLMGLHVETVIASIREPSDFSGLPILDRGEVRFAPPSWAKRLAEAGRGILFLDEISTAPPAVQAALLRVVLDRVVGDLALPDDVAVVAAANPPDQAAGGWELSSPLANRFVHLSWSVSAKTWAEGMISGWKTEKIPILPPDWVSNIQRWRLLTASFIMARQNALMGNPRGDDTGRAFPTPRTWEMAARLCAASEAAGEIEAMKLLAVGAVGDGAGIEFLAWLRDVNLPDAEELLRDPDGFTLPARGDIAFAILGSVASAVISNPTPERWRAGWKILGAAAKQVGADMAVPAVRSMLSARGCLPLPTEEIKPFIKLIKGTELL